MANCTIIDYFAYMNPKLVSSSGTVILNSIIWGNSMDTIDELVTINYSNIENLL